ncbi:MAG TPA: hypothetical protein VIL30_20960 [Ramlibacter sp.]
MTITNRDDVPSENVPDAAHESAIVSETSVPATDSPPAESTPIAVDQTLDSTAAEQAVMGVAEPASSIPVAAPRAKTRGVADIVFLIDISGSMKPCIDALRANIELFIDFLSKGNANEGLRDWRGKAVGYRDFDAAEGEGLPWIVDNPFVRNASDMKNQLGWLEAAGGGDEPESLLDALYTISTMEALPKGAQTEDPAKWRYRSDAARVVIVFTDASFKETMSLPQARGGSLQDVANAVMANRIILSLFAPNFEGYDRMSQIDKCEWEVVEYDGLSPQEALRQFTADPANFRTTLKQLAASVSRSAETIAL